MQAHPTTPVASTPGPTTPTPPRAAPDAPTPVRDTPLTGIERLMADALSALGAPGSAAATDAASVEYASWLARLRRARP